MRRGKGGGGFRGWLRYLGLALGQARRELVSYITAVPLLVFLLVVVYLGLFSMIRLFAAEHPGLLGAWTFLAFSLCHYAAALCLSPLEDPGLRAFSAAAGLRGRGLSSLLGTWFVARNWHVPLVEILLFLPAAAGGPRPAVAISALVAYGPASLISFGSLAFAARSRASARRAPRPVARGRAVGRGPAFPLARSIMSASDALACVAVAVAVELAGASDLLRHPSPSGDPGRWLALLAFCAAVLSQAALSVAYRIPKRYYRMLPVSFATYSSHACAPLLAASAASLSPLLYGIAARCPDRLPGALLFVAAFSIAPFAIAENRESSRAVAALSLLAFGIAVAVLSAILPIAAYAAASFAVLLALGYGRRHFLRDEVLE